MFTIAIAPFAVGAVALVVATVVLGFGYRRLPARIPKLLDVDNVVTTTSGRRELQALAARNDPRLTMPRSWLLIGTLGLWSMAIQGPLGGFRFAAQSTALLRMGLVIYAALFAFASLVFATLVFFQVRAARSTAAFPPGRIVPAWFSGPSRIVFVAGLLLLALYCAWAFVLIHG